MNGVKIWLCSTSRYLFLFLFVFVAPLSAQLENGLVAYFPLDGNGTDLVSGANGTIYGATPVENRWGDSGQAYSFDGTDDYIEVPFQTTYSNDVFSFSLWVKPTATSSQHSSPLTFRASARGHILYKTPQNSWAAWVGTGGTWAENVLGSIEVGNWQFIASTYASGSFKGYVDGDLVATISPSFSKNTSSPLRIGAGKTEGSPEFFFAGVVDEVRLYNRALSATEVQQLQVVDHKEVPPSNLRTVGGLAITENSAVGTVAGEFNATDLNGDTLSYALMPALPSAFSPVLWLDANDSSTVIESSGAVSAWQDKSGNDYHFTQNDSNRYPLYSTSSLNGMPTITFDGSNDYLSNSSRLGFSANPDLSVFAVTSFLSLSDNDERIFQIGSNSHGLAVTGGIGSWCWRFNGGHERYNDVTINKVAQQAWVRQAGTNYQASRFFYNGLEQARVAGSSDASSPTNVAEIASIGKSTTGSNFANVKISELIVLNDYSDASRRGIETYLARKWGLTYTQPRSNGIFEIESNGTLKSLVSLDKETVATLPITVRATDPTGNFIEQSFSVTVEDDGLEDTDSDGFLDSVEYQEGSDPSSNSSIPGLDYGLTAWYPFDGNASDMSGNGRNATANNSHSYVSAKVGNGVRVVGSYSGVTGHVSLPYTSSLENSDTTFAFWVLEEAMLQNHGEAYLAYGQIESVLNYSGGQPFSFSSSTSYIAGITRSAWNHYAVTKIGSVKKGYLNGTMVAQGSWTAPSSYSPTLSALGRHWWADGAASSTRLVATFDDLRIYDRALLASEITALQTWTPSVATPLNNAPTTPVLSQSQVSENQAVGTSIGQFSATDPDGDTISFNLVQGVGDTGNAHFILETNGSLKTAVTFDFENNASTYSIRVQARDEHNLSTEGNFTLSLIDLDDTVPLISLNGDSNITHEAGTVYIDANASWTDAVDGSGSILASGQINAGTPGVYVLSFNYTDAAGNAAQTVTRTIHVVDTILPVISLNGDANITHEGGSPYLDANASWTDAVDGSGVVYASGEANASDPGVYVLSFSYTDAAGNAAQTVTRTVQVVDTTLPVISLNGDANITHEGGSPYLDANASWTDAVDGSGVVYASGEANASDPGVYELSYDYTDAAGNAAQTVTRTIHVVDTILPVISLNGDANITHEGGSPYLDANASWSDAVDGSGTVYARGEVNASVPGVYVLSYDYTDAAGNVAQTVTRTVHVVDTILPVINLNGDANITHEGGSPYLDANASWTDAVDGGGTVLASGEVNPSIPGTYLLDYDYTDAAGNSAQTVTRRVEVINLSPHDLFTVSDSNLSVFENEPNGTWVANFEGLDGNPDHVLFYELVRVSDGNQSGEQNASYGNLSELGLLNVFQLDTNGSLTTLRPIDYEIDPLEFEIVVRVIDQHGAYFEAAFLVNVLNVVEDLDNDGIEDHYDLDDDGDGYPDEVEKTYGFNPRERWEYPEVPIVRTLELIEESNETLRFGMEILAEGGFKELQVGIEVFDLSGNLLLQKIFEWNASSVAKVTFLEDGFFRGQVIRYQAYAENLAGRTFGQLMEYRVGGDLALDTWWASDLESTGGWRESIWMGTYLPNLKNNWIYHLKLGWLFTEVDQQGGYWMWMSNNGWLWTNQETWPFLWSNETADWLYPVYSGNKLYFYDYQTESFR